MGLGVMCGADVWGWGGRYLRAERHVQAVGVALHALGGAPHALLARDHRSAALIQRHLAAAEGNCR